MPGRVARQALRPGLHAARSPAVGDHREQVARRPPRHRRRDHRRRTRHAGANARRHRPPRRGADAHRPSPRLRGRARARAGARCRRPQLSASARRGRVGGHACRRGRQPHRGTAHGPSARHRHGRTPRNESPARLTGPAVPAPPPPARHRRLRGALHLVFGLAVAVVVLWAVGGQRGELQGAVSYLENLKWQWVVLAAVMEFLAIVAFGAMQRVLIEAGGVHARLADMTTIAFAGNAIQNSLPAGPLWSNVFAFRQFKRRAADDVLAVWVLVATSIASAASLALVAVLGLIFARNQGVAVDLVAVAGGIVGLLLIVRYLLRRHHR